MQVSPEYQDLWLAKGKKFRVFFNSRPSESTKIELGQCFYCGEEAKERDLLLRWDCGKCRPLTQ